jgi:hypothetical protein
MPKSRKRTNKRTGKPVRYSPQRQGETRAEYFRQLAEMKGEAARQREWKLDATAGRNIPEYFDYVEYRDDDSPKSRTEIRYVAGEILREEYRQGAA